MRWRMGRFVDSSTFRALLLFTMCTAIKKGSQNAKLQDKTVYIAGGCAGVPMA
jgi:hypothetical protein